MIPLIIINNNSNNNYKKIIRIKKIGVQVAIYKRFPKKI